MTHKAQKIHDSLCAIVAERLADSPNIDYDVINTNLDYLSYQRRKQREMDVVADLSLRYKLIFEVKCNNTPKGKGKASEQLNVAYRTFKQHYDRVFLFYVHRDKDGALKYNRVIPHDRPKP